MIIPHKKLVSYMNKKSNLIHYNMFKAFWQILDEECSIGQSAAYTNSENKSIKKEQ